MEIRQLKKEAYAGRKFTARYQTNGYYDICACEGGFQMRYTPFASPEERAFDIVVCREYQNRHIGRRCVLEMLRLAREKRMARVMKINAADGTLLYAGSGKDATSFALNIQESGAYTVAVEARRAKGSIYIQAVTD